MITASHLVTGLLTWGTTSWLLLSLRPDWRDAFFGQQTSTRRVPPHGSTWALVLTLAYVSLMFGNSLLHTDRAPVTTVAQLQSFTLVLSLMTAVLALLQRYDTMRAPAAAEGTGQQCSVAPGETPGWWHIARPLVKGVWLLGLVIVPTGLLMVLMIPWRTPDREHELLRLLAGSTDWSLLAWVTLLTVVIGPLNEELIFRVILQDRLSSLWPGGWALGVVVALFVAVHGWTDAIPLIPLALALGFVRQQTGAYASLVVTHGLFNGVNLLLVIVRPT